MRLFEFLTKTLYFDLQFGGEIGVRGCLQEREIMENPKVIVPSTRGSFVHFLVFILGVHDDDLRGVSRSRASTFRVPSSPVASSLFRRCRRSQSPSQGPHHRT